MAVRSLGKRWHASSEVGGLMGLVVASKRRGPATVGRRLIEAPRQVRTSEREKGSMLVGRLVEASGLLKIFFVVRAAKLRMRKWRSSQLNGKMSSVVRLWWKPPGC